MTNLRLAYGKHWAIALSASDHASLRPTNFLSLEPRLHSRITIKGIRRCSRRSTTNIANIADVLIRNDGCEGVSVVYATAAGSNSPPVARWH